MSKCKHLNEHETEMLILNSERRDIIVTWDKFPVMKEVFLKGTADEKFIQFSNNKWAAKKEEHQLGQEKEQTITKDKRRSLLVLGAVSSLATLLPQPGNTVGYIISSEESSSSESLPLEVTSAVMMLDLPWSPKPHGLLLAAVHLSCLPYSQPYNHTGEFTALCFPGAVAAPALFTHKGCTTTLPWPCWRCPTRALRCILGPFACSQH